MQTPRDSDSRTMPWTLRDQEAEFNRLQQENFNYKLRIHFLEEQLVRLNNGDTVFGSEELEAEVAQLRSTLKDRDQKLAEQDASMTRAMQTIELLQEQLHETQPRAQSLRDVRPVREDAVAPLRAELENMVQQSSCEERDLELELRSANEHVDMLNKEVQYAQETYNRDMDVEEKAKERYKQICEYQKSQNDKLREELAHVRRMMEGKDELVGNLRAKVDSIWQRKKQEAKAHTATLARLLNETKEARLEEEQCHASWHDAYALLKENWENDQSGLVARNKMLMVEASKLTR